MTENEDDPQVRLDRAVKDFEARRFNDAADGFRAVIAKHPDVGELHINLGAALRGADALEQAEQAYRDAIDRLPDSALAWFNLANLLRDLYRGEEALAAYRKADTLQPGTAEILNNLGAQLYDMGAIEDALRQYDAAIAVRPDFADAITNRGNALQRLCRMDEAEAAIEQALSLSPDHPVYLLNKSAFLAATGRHAEALNWADKAVAADPGYTQAKLKRASLLIQSGNLDEGFREYEARWQIPRWHRLHDALPIPPWQGGDVSGKRLLLWNEQGFGDALMYARYIPRLAESGAHLTLMCETALHRLFKQSFGDIVEIADLNETPPDADMHASLMSLPHLMQTTMASIPADIPYLAADTAEVAAWSAEIDTLACGKPALGLVWAGNPGQAHDYSRSMSPGDMAPLLARDDVCFFNLLVGPRGNELQHDHIIDVRTRLTDFAATAALMTALDRVISVDSGPAHLAGALGVPLWVALAYDPDSRYFLKSEQTPWYPQASLLRQPAPGDWSSVVGEISRRLDQKIA